MRRRDFNYFCCVVIIILGISIYACTRSSSTEKDDAPPAEPEVKRVQYVIIPYNETDSGISIVEVDGCQYIYCESSQGVAITHKENCTNFQHDK